MDENSKLKLIYEEAVRFLKNKVENEILKKHLEHYHTYRPKSLEDVFKKMVETLKNRQGFVNYIAPTEELCSIMFDFNPKKVLEKYFDWKQLFNQLKKKFSEKYIMDINENRNSWVLFSKGIISCAKFISNFNDFHQFDEFVQSFFFNEFTIASLPMLLEKEIFGYGFALACDLLKELGYVQYGKPDTHIKKIFNELEIVNSNDDFEVFKKIVKIGLIVNEDPVIVDKVFWLIGSGKFHFSKIEIGSQKREFINHIKNKINKMT